MPSDLHSNQFSCPACDSTIARDAKFCPACSFHYEQLIGRFGSIPRYDAHVTDVTESTLSLRTISSLQRLIQRFESRFPQIRLSVIIVALQAGWNLGEYSFYLANRCNFMASTHTGPDNHLILISIDINLKQVAIATGYGLESVLNREELYRVTVSAAKYLPQGKYKAFVRDVVGKVTGSLLDKLN